MNWTFPTIPSFPRAPLRPLLLARCAVGGVSLVLRLVGASTKMVYLLVSIPWESSKPWLATWVIMIYSNLLCFPFVGKYANIYIYTHYTPSLNHCIFILKYIFTHIYIHIHLFISYIHMHVFFHKVYISSRLLEDTYTFHKCLLYCSIPILFY